jgi:hypothetical protein
MASAIRMRSTLIAVLLGVFWLFLLPELYLLGLRITVALMRVVYGAGFGPLLVRVLNVAIWSLILGLLFGVPLALAARNQVFRHWLVFVASILIASAATAVWTEPGLGILAVEWTTPEVWAYLGGVLLVALLFMRVRYRRAGGSLVAP